MIFPFLWPARFSIVSQLSLVFQKLFLFHIFQTGFWGLCSRQRAQCWKTILALRELIRTIFFLAIEQLKSRHDLNSTAGSTWFYIFGVKNHHRTRWIIANSDQKCSVRHDNEVLEFRPSSLSVLKWPKSWEPFFWANFFFRNSFSFLACFLSSVWYNWSLKEQMDMGMGWTRTLICGNISPTLKCFSACNYGGQESVGKKACLPPCGPSRTENVCQPSLKYSFFSCIRCYDFQSWCFFTSQGFPRPNKASGRASTLHTNEVKFH